MQAELGQWITEGTEYPDDQPERGVISTANQGGASIYRRSRRCSRQKCHRIDPVGARDLPNLRNRQLPFAPQQPIGDRRIDPEQFREVRAAFLAFSEDEAQQLCPGCPAQGKLRVLPFFLEITQEVEVVGLLGVERMSGELVHHLGGIIRINLVANGAEQVQPHQACIGFGDFRERR